MNLTPMQQKQIDYILDHFDFELVKKCQELKGDRPTIEILKADALKSMQAAFEEGRDICSLAGFYTRHWDYGLITLDFVLFSVCGGCKTMSGDGMGIKIGDDETVIPV